MKRNLIVFLILFLLIAFRSDFIWAAGGAHGEGIPWSTVSAQIFNVVVMVFGLVYFLRTKIQDLFKQRRADFESAAKKSLAELQLAQQDHLQMKSRLEKLESTAESSLQKAKIEAEAMKKQLVEEANDLVKKINQEARQAAQLELQRAKNELKIRMMNEAFNFAKITVKERAPQSQDRFENDFVSEMSREGQL